MASWPQLRIDSVHVKPPANLPKVSIIMAGCRLGCAAQGKLGPWLHISPYISIWNNPLVNLLSVDPKCGDYHGIFPVQQLFTRHIFYPWVTRLPKTWKSHLFLEEACWWPRLLHHACGEVHGPDLLRQTGPVRHQVTTKKGGLKPLNLGVVSGKMGKNWM